MDHTSSIFADKVFAQDIPDWQAREATTLDPLSGSLGNIGATDYIERFNTVQRNFEEHLDHSKRVVGSRADPHEHRITRRYLWNCQLIGFESLPLMEFVNSSDLSHYLGWKFSTQRF